VSEGKGRRKAGHSAVVPFRPCEGVFERHYRRKDVAWRLHRAAGEWCAEHGIRMTVHNAGHHWTFAWVCSEEELLSRGVILETVRQKRRHCLAEWWPSSAKLIFDKLWRGGVHCHGWLQVQKELCKRWNIQEQDNGET